MAPTFIRVIEMWMPSPDQPLLEFGGGLFGEATRFAAISRQMCFGMGEGLPGQAWEEGRPVLLKQFEGSHFRRIDAARAAGLSGGLAVPIWLGGALKAVLVLYVGDTAQDTGAIELWHNDPRVTGDMTLVEGHYGPTAPALEADSRDAYMPRGTGLPGLAWQRDAVVFMDDLGATGRFLRASGAASAGIERGLAVPCATLSDEACVAVFLSAPGSPMAQRIESWAPADASAGASVSPGLSLHRRFGFCETLGALPADQPLLDPATSANADADAGGTVAQAWRTGVPVLLSSLAGQPAPVAAAAEAGISSLLAWPVVTTEGQVGEVLVLYF